MFTSSTQKPYGFWVCSIVEGKLSFYDSFERKFICDVDENLSKKSNNLDGSKMAPLRIPAQHIAASNN